MTATRTVVVSGGGTGIGAAVAETLSQAGTHVTVVGRRREPLERLADRLGPDMALVAADVSTPEGASTVAAAIHASGRRASALVAAAGGLSPGGVDDLEAVRGSWQACFESNVLTAVLLFEALRSDLVDLGGRVVLMSSIAAYRGSGGGPYGAMKAALHGWVHDIARDLGANGGTANVIAPGFVPDTEFWQGRLTDEGIQQRTAQTLVGRAGTPREIASLVAWLLGRDGGWVTGQILSPNGGAVLGR